MTVSDPGLILPESACRWPQVFHTQAIRLRPMTLFNPVFNRQTPIVIRRLKTQADEGLGPQPKAGDSSRRSWLCRSASAPSQQACEPVQDRCSGPCSRTRHAAAWRSRNRAPARGRLGHECNHSGPGPVPHGTQWFSRSGAGTGASSGERAILEDHLASGGGSGAKTVGGRAARASLIQLGSP